jgi:flagellar hook-associated protein 3 FlgL
MMRVTEGSAAWGSLNGLQSTAGRLAALQSQLSSGKQITRISDSPVGTTTALGIRGELKRMDQYASGASDALGWLTATDTSLSTAVTQLQSARTAVVAGLNTGANDANARNALAAQIDQLRSSLIGVANSAYLGRPIFGGTTASPTAFDPTTGAYTGDGGTVTRDVAPNNTVTVNATGTAVFGPTGSSVFDVLASISANLRTNPSALSADLVRLDTATSRISSQQAAAGATYSRVQSTQNAAATNSIQLKSQLSDLEDIDIADMAIKVSTADAAYQAALATTAKVRQNSLLDFLR